MMKTTTTNTPDHYHVHYGDADELGENDDLAYASPVVPTLAIVLDDVVKFLIEQRGIVSAENVADLTTYRTLTQYLSLLHDMDDDHVNVIETAGVELEIEAGLSVSVVPCNGYCETL